jgi:protein-S-isoprenylcysteine O-methyltransferase Ste14
MSARDVFRLLLGIPWLVFVLYWLVRAFNTRTTRQKEPFTSRYGVLLVEIVGFLLIFRDRIKLGFLENRFIPHSLLGAVTGTLLTWMGLALAIWARHHLAEYWSARVTIKEDHKLIRTGPYSHLRHPIYSGLDLAALGSALVIGKWRCVLGLCLVVAGYWVKAKKEESMLSQQFGQAFREHQKHTGFLFPRFSPGEVSES